MQKFKEFFICKFENGKRNSEIKKGE